LIAQREWNCTKASNYNNISCLLNEFLAYITVKMVPTIPSYK
jgi:hypothetical protein